MRINEDFLDDNIEVRADDNLSELEGEALKEPTPSDFRVCLYAELQYDMDHAVYATDLRKTMMLVARFLDNCPSIEERSHIRMIDYGSTKDFHDDIMNGSINVLNYPEMEVAFNGAFSNVKQSLRFIHTYFQILLKGLRFKGVPKLFVIIDSAESSGQFNLEDLAYSWQVKDQAVFDALMISEGKSSLSTNKGSDHPRFREAYSNTMFLSALLTDFKSTIFDDVERMFQGKYSNSVAVERRTMEGLKFAQYGSYWEIAFPDRLKDMFSSQVVNNELFRNLPLAKRDGCGAYLVMVDEMERDPQNEAYSEAKQELLDKPQQYKRVRFMCDGKRVVLLMQTPAVRVFLSDGGGEYVMFCYSWEFSTSYKNTDEQILELLFDGFKRQDYYDMLEVFKHNIS